MATYIVATVRITDPDRFAAYGAAIAGLSERFGGEPILRGSVIAVLEGDGPAGERVVVTRFPDAVAARDYIASADYRAAVVQRVGAADVTMRLVETPM